MPLHNFKKISSLKKLHIKFSNKEAYKKYKYELNQYRLYEKRRHDIQSLLSNKALLNPDIIKQLYLQNNGIHFSHSGNAGDIIYSLPMLKAIAILIGKPVSLYLDINQTRKSHPTYVHPLGMLMMNSKMAEMLIPLIINQAYIEKCEILENQRIDIGLDQIRKAGFLLDRGNITHWYSYLTCVPTDTLKPWIKAKPNKSLNNKIVIARSGRYRNPFIDYSFLKRYPNTIFTGLKEEFEDMKTAVPDLEWQPVDDFLELAEIISSCKLFIGNQSFPFAIAEGLKVPRILEKDYEEPNVIPEGETGHEFYFQEHFEYLVEHLVNNQT